MAPFAPPVGPSADCSFAKPFRLATVLHAIDQFLREVDAPGGVGPPWRRGAVSIAVATDYVRDADLFLGGSGRATAATCEEKHSIKGALRRHRRW
jgi:hypothetical protein